MSVESLRKATQGDGTRHLDEPYPGTTGLYGRLVLAAGVLAVVAEIVLLLRGNRLLRRGVGVFGVLLLGFVGWLGIGLFEVLDGLATNPLLVAEPGGRSRQWEPRWSPGRY